MQLQTQDTRAKGFAVQTTLFFSHFSGG